MSAFFRVWLLLLLVCSTFTSKGQDLQVLLDSSRYYWDAQNFEKAFGLLATGVEVAKGLHEKQEPNGTMNYAYLLNQMGVRLYQAEVLDKAEAYYRAAIPLFLNIEGENGPNYLTAVENLALCLNDAGKFAEAFEQYEILVNNPLYVDSQGEMIYQTYNTAGICAYQANNFDRSISLYESALSFLTPTHQDYWIITENILILTQTWAKGKEAAKHLQPFLEKFPEKEAEYRNLIAYMNQDFGVEAMQKEDYLTAIPYLEKTLQYLEIKDETDQQMQVYRRQDLCFAYTQTRQFAKNIALMVTNMEAVGEHYGEGSGDHLAAVNNLALAYTELGKYKEAERTFKHGFKLFEKLSSKSDDQISLYGNLLGNSTDLMIKQGRYDEAKEYNQKAIDFYGQDEEKYFEDLLFTLNQTAMILITTGKYEKAEGLLLQLLARQQEKNGLENDMGSTIASNLTSVYLQTGRYDRAIDFTQFILEIDKKIHGERSYYYAFSLQTAGITLFSIQDYEGAIEYLEKSLAIRKDMVGEENQELMRLEQSLASAYTKAGQLDKSEAILNQLYTKQKKSLGNKHIDIALTLSDLGMLSYSRGKFEEAASYFQDALEIDEKVLGAYNEFTVTALFNLACSYQAQNLTDKAIVHFDDAVASYLHIVDEFFPFLGEKERLEYYFTIQGQLSAYYSLLNFELDKHPEYASKIYNTHIRTKGMLLNESMELRNFLNNQQDPAIKIIYDKWIGVNQEVAKMEQLSLSSSQQIYVDSLKIAGEELERMLNSQTKTDTKTPTWQAVSKSLKDGEVAVEIMRIAAFDFKNNKHLEEDKNYLALIIDNKSTVPDFVRFTNGQEMDSRLFNAYKNKIKFQLEDKDSHGHFWKPLAEKLRGYETVYLSQDGVFQLLNLNTLLNPETGKYVIDEWNIQVLGNTRELIGRQTSTTASKSATLFGFPNFTTHPDQNATETSRSGVYKEIFTQGVSDLPGTKIELENIDQLMSSKGIETTSFLADEAHEAQFKSVSSTDILHIATHGFFEESDGPLIKDDPLLHSGLLLANLKETITPEEENGIITAKEIAQMNLQDTELVVLSACETGKGKVMDGQGVYGLQRAFQVAGADNVIISLWKVDDEATKELMTLFYPVYLQTGDPRASLKTAQLQLKEKFPEPIYWGAFYVVGN